MFYFLSDLISVAQFIIYLFVLFIFFCTQFKDIIYYQYWFLSFTFLSDLISDLISHPENILFISFFLSDLISDLNSDISNILAYIAYIFATEFNIR